MDRKKKKRSNRKRQRNFDGTPMQSRPTKDSVDLAVEIFQESIEEDVTTLETPFGNLLIGSSNLFGETIRNKYLLYDMLHDPEADIYNSKDMLTHFVRLEKLNDKYPNEPFLKHSIALAYRGLEYEDKYKAAIKENFDLFNGENPDIDVAYIQYLLELDEMEVASKFVGNSLNLHQFYPNLTAFEKDLVSDFYRCLFDICIYRKDTDNANKCIQVIKNVDPKIAKSLEDFLDFYEHPWKAWLNLLMVLGVLVGILWLIIKLFQWIF